MKRALLLVASAHLLIAGACGQMPTLDSGYDPEPGDPRIVLDHELLDFGAVEVGAPELAKAWLTINNLGDDDLHIVEIRLEDPDGPFDVGQPGAVVLAPSAAAGLELTYRPTTATTDSTRLFIGTDDPLNPTVDVWLAGSGIAPVLSISPEGALFEGGTVGCEQVESILLANLGNTTLEVLGLDLEEQGSLEGEWAFTGLDDENGDAEPGLVELGPGEHRLLELTYLPIDEIADRATLTIASNDPSSPTRAVSYQGDAEATGWVQDAFEQPLDEAMDVIVALDKGGSMDDDLELVASNLQSLAAGLVGTEVDLQFAISGEDGGCVNGRDIWIDGGFTASEAGSTVTTMVNASGPYNSNAERAFSQLRDIIAESGRGGCNEGLVREHATLHLIAISDEPEQSSESWTWHLAELQATKADPDDVIIHGVGGDYPGGCGGSAEAYTGVYEAVAATGGTFLSICASSWWESMLHTLEHIESFNDRFELTQPAVAETITVTVDEVTTTSGWSYDEATTAVVFDSDHIPEGGATIEVSYAVRADCEEDAR